MAGGLVLALSLIAFGPLSSSAVSATTTKTTTSSVASPASTGPGLDTAVEGTAIGRLAAVPGATTTPATADLSTPAAQEAYLTAVFNDIQSMWRSEFTQAGVSYSPAHLNLFTSVVRTACGIETAAVGPFYCPGDRTVYLDVNFFTSLDAEFGVSGDFAEAYVVAHEVGHHVQNLLGITQRTVAAMTTYPSEANAISVRVELQADCLAGVWAHSTYERDLLEPGDIEEALRAAEVVGDDYLAESNGTPVNQDSWTHGSSAQRQEWFTTGFEDGTPGACDTFAGL